MVLKLFGYQYSQFKHCSLSLRWSLALGYLADRFLGQPRWTLMRGSTFRCSNISNFIWGYGPI